MSVTINNGSANNTKIENQNDQTTITIEGLTSKPSGIAKISLSSNAIQGQTVSFNVHPWPNTLLEGVQFENGNDLIFNYRVTTDSNYNTLHVAFNTDSTAQLKQGGVLTLIDVFR
jgi:hypothetical protein